MGGVHGVCHGWLGDNLPSHADVVQLYKSHNIHAMRIYSPDHGALAALRRSGIGLILDVGGVDAVRDLASSAAAATVWVQAYYPDVLIKYIAVGNEVGAGDVGLILPAMRNVHAALVAAGFSGVVRVSTAVKMDVFTNTFPPSSGVFHPDVARHMVPVARFLADTRSPLLANVYPYFAYRGSPGGISLGYATFQPGATTTVSDSGNELAYTNLFDAMVDAIYAALEKAGAPGAGVSDSGNGLAYTNLFDAMVDAIYAALEKAGAPGVRVVVSESGWPSAGGFAASVDNARAYNQGLIDHVCKGTPKRPGVLETYVFAMFNENQKPGDATERNFGLFCPDKQPVYPITFPK